MLEPSGEAYVLVSAADPDLVLVVDQDADLIPLTRAPPPFTFADRGPRPRVARREDAPAAAARFLISVSTDLYLQNVSYQTLALECPGDAGWGHGAPVETTLKRGGATQRWSFEPPLRSRQELMFHDVVAPAAEHGLDVGGLACLRDDWAAIADDLRAGADQILRCAERGQPFVAAGSVVDVLDGWRRLAAEARNASADLAGLREDADMPDAIASSFLAGSALALTLKAGAALAGFRAGRAAAGGRRRHGRRSRPRAGRGRAGTPPAAEAERRRRPGHRLARQGAGRRKRRMTSTSSGRRARASRTISSRVSAETCRSTTWALSS
ncbi:hypothetical protein ACRAWD_29400 [Caulobacter segnis]